MRWLYLPLSAASIMVWLAGPAGAAWTEPMRLPEVHVVGQGETVWAISRMHGTAPDSVVIANRLVRPDVLHIGDRLLIPPAGSAQPPPLLERVAGTRGLHVVQSGETLWRIAVTHETSVDVLVRLNGIGDPDRIRQGWRLWVRQPGSAGRVSPPMAWPARGRITSRFGFRGTRHHHGIDIAAPMGGPIYAAQAGRVAFAGRRGEYGLLVVLDHGGGLTTWYGHASGLLVTAGQSVQGGQLVAEVGSTGRVTGPNVHFEVRRDDQPLDPLMFLDRR